MTWLIALLQRVGNSATGGAVVVLADSACCSAAFCGAVRQAGAGLSVMVRIDPEIAGAIAAGVLGVSGRLAVACVRAAAAPVGLG